MTTSGPLPAPRVPGTETNGVIGALTPDGWFGVYHDFAPLGATGHALWRALHEGFAANVSALIDHVMGEHYGWTRFDWPKGDCFCHRPDGRIYVPGWPPRVARMLPWSKDVVVEERQECTAESCDPVNIHVIWAFGPNELRVLGSGVFEQAPGADLLVNGRRVFMRHVELASFPVRSREPDWVDVEQRMWAAVAALD